MLSTFVPFPLLKVHKLTVTEQSHIKKRHQNPETVWINLHVQNGIMYASASFCNLCYSRICLFASKGHWTKKKLRKWIRNLQQEKVIKKSKSIQVSHWCFRLSIEKRREFVLQFVQDSGWGIEKLIRIGEEYPINYYLFFF